MVIVAEIAASRQFPRSLALNHGERTISHVIRGCDSPRLSEFSPSLRIQEIDKKNLESSQSRAFDIVAACVFLLLFAQIIAATMFSRNEKNMQIYYAL